MTNRIHYIVMLCLLLFMIQAVVIAQDESDSCDYADLGAKITDITAEIEAGGAEYFYQLGEIYSEFALTCGYQPDTEEIINQINRSLELAPLSFIIAQSSIGNDVDAAMAELENINGDSFNGQLLYNGLEMGLDGTALGCSGCHVGQVAPVIEATYTRTEEIRLADPLLADYTVTQYLVESILHPSAYITPGFEAVMMTDNYGGRLTAQQLADLVAYLESQDQFLEEDSSATASEVIGDPVRGEALYNGLEMPDPAYVSCSVCHRNAVVGPELEGIATHITEERLTLPEFANYTVEQYISESILVPNNYVVPGYSENIMPLNYGELLSQQDIADLIAYLLESDE